MKTQMIRIVVLLAAAAALGAGCGDDDGTAVECGNGVLETGEACDGADFGSETCQSQGFTGGSLACTPQCQLDTSGCTGGDVCGNGSIGGGEVCDGSALGGEDCQSQGFDGGTLACAGNCLSFDTTGCTGGPVCGDDVAEGAEMCDGLDLDGEDCVSQGFDTGTLVCANDCLSFDTSQCTTFGCGDNVVNGSEVCDGTDLDGETCITQGYDAGTLACVSNCTAFVTTGCVNQCGPMLPVDVTPIVGSATALFDTASENNDFTGSCGGDTAPDLLLSFVAPQAATYIVSTANPSTDYDTAIYAFTDCADPTGTEVACNDDRDPGYDLRSEIAVGAAAGETIFVVLDGYGIGGNAEVTVLPIICGDGVLAPGEQCDDGNTTAGDGCDPSCLFECVDDAQEDDDDVASANVLSGGSPYTGGGTLCPNDPSPGNPALTVDFYTVTVPAGQVLDFEIGPGATTDCTQQQLAFQVLPPSLSDTLAYATSDGTSCPAVSGVSDPSGGTTLVIAVYADVNHAPQDYTFTATVRAPVCGNSVVEAGEQCDDGNTASGDGCDSGCQWECTDDANEDNDDEANATPLTGAFPITTSGVLCPGDNSPFDPTLTLDFFTVTVPAGEVLDIAIGPGATTDCTQQQLGLNVLEPGLTVLIDQAFSNGATCPAVYGIAPSTGSQVIIALAAGITDPAQDYTLIVSSRVPVCGDGFVDPGEDCDDGNNVNGDGCEADCTLLPQPACSLAADSDLGTLPSGPTNASVNLVGEGNNLVDLSCVVATGGGGAADYQYHFSVTTAGTLTVDYDHTGADVQYAIFRDDANCTEELCFDPFPSVVGQFSHAVTPGDYRLVLEAWSPGWEGPVDLTLTAP